MGTRAEADELRRRRDWSAAYEAYAGIQPQDGPVTEGLAESTWWLGNMEEAIRLYADAYRLHVDAGDLESAARTAVLLSIHCRLVGESAQSAGWDSRAQRVLEDLPECAAHGYPLYLGTAGLTGSDLDAADASARRMQDLGRNHGDPNLVALGVYFEGRIRIKQARVAEGLALLDEAMVAALSDDLDTFWTGAIYCGLMDACNELRDLRRASEWTEATRRWSDPLPLASLYPGICRVHRAQVLQSRGSWAEAEQEALGACEDMAGIDVFAVADAYYEVGEVRRVRGDLAGAEQAYHQAHDHGRDPQPGMALLRLAQGRPDEAAASISAVLCAGGRSRLDRASLLAAQTTIALASGDLDLAEEASGELATTAHDFDSPGLRADSHRSCGSVMLARGRTMEALAELRLAFNAWNQLDVPYEAARTRMLLAQAYRACGDTDAAVREESAAQACFERLGVLTVETSDSPDGLTAREIEVLRVLATGKSNKEIAEELFLSPKTVARHLSNIFAKTGATSRAAATAYAYDSGLMAR
ncbi:LuxR family transcriptional regulator [Nocardioides marmorisolisilvae]|uniref:LuxR family transcriptional regulator n=1 Tax=Nocardioides marmorisolisilvae TaxID=1542737 RepID=UPI00248328E3|nr:LuxR family transcriptional regulator [Nocardioides marmorisolisilvae]